MKKWKLIGGLLAAILVFAVTAPADVIDPTATVGTPAPAGATAGLAGPLGMVGGIVGGAIVIDLPVGPQPGWYLTISVADCCIVGDVFEVLLDGVSLGITAPVPQGGPTLSTGSFTVFALPGLHSIDIWDFILSYIGSAHPFGGGVVPDIMSPAGLSVSWSIEPIPEPGTLILLGTGLLGLGASLRKRFARPN